MISFSAFTDELCKIAEAKVPLGQADARVFKELMKGSTVKVKVTSGAHAYGGGYFDQQRKEIGLSEKKFSTLAHELGHVDIDKHLLGRLIQSRAARLANTATPLAGIGAALLLAKGKKWGLLLPAALAAPTLLSEALASFKGHKKLEEAKASSKQKSQYKNEMIDGFSSYAIRPTITTAMASLGLT